MKRYLILFFLSTAFYANILFSQEYKTSLGFRGGFTTGLTFKHFIKDGAALEAILSTGWRSFGGYQLTGLYEIHKEAFVKNDMKGMFWFYGGGGHVATGYRVWHHKTNYTGDWVYYNAFGIDGIFGMEYKIEDVPITLSVDVKPFFEIATSPDAPFGFWDMGFSIRYVFGQK